MIQWEKDPFKPMVTRSDCGRFIIMPYYDPEERIYYEAWDNKLSTYYDSMWGDPSGPISHCEKILTQERVA